MRKKNMETIMTQQNSIKNIALKASAGTGKTYQLAIRILLMLLKNIDPKDILGLTFTKKATDEMLERILFFLDKLTKFNGMDSAESDDKHLFECVIAELTEHAKRNNKEYSDAYLAQVANETKDKLLSDFRALKIKTFDSFFNMILKAFPFEANLRPDYDIVTDEQVADYNKLAFKQIAHELIKDEIWKEIIQIYPSVFGGTAQQTISKMKKLASETAEKDIMLNDAIIEAQKAGPKALLETMHEALAVKEDIFNNVEKFKTTFKHETNSTQEKALQKIYSAKDVNGLLGCTPIVQSIENHSSFRKINFAELELRIFKDIRDGISTFLSLQAFIAEQLSLLLGAMLATRIKEFKNTNNTLTYSDLAEYVYDMLARGENGIDSDYLYFRLDGQLNHILIDEFQDTSSIQWLIMKKLVDEALSGIGQYDKSGSFFYVGDPKQNIYRFRGGSSELFDWVLNSYETVEEQTLEKNFRSSKHIVEFVNDICNQFGLDMFKLNQQYNEGGYEGHVSVTELSKEDTFLTYTLAKVEELKKAEVKLSDIAILTGSNDKGAELANMLQENNIAVKLETSGKINSTRIYKAVINLVKFIETGDPFAFINYALVDAPSISLKDFANDSRRAEIMAQIRNSANSLNNATIFRKLLHVITEENCLKRFRCEPNFVATIDLIAKAAANEKHLSTFIEKVDSAASSYVNTTASDEKAITIMTVHKSKGLEFPVVILPNLEFELKHNGAKHSKFVTLDNEQLTQSTLHYIHNKDAYSMLGTHEQHIKKIVDANVRKDALNNLYVAMTRAKNILYIASKPVSSVANSAMQLINEICNTVDHERGSLDGYIGKKEEGDEKCEEIAYVPNRDVYEKTPLDEFDDIDFQAINFGNALHKALMLVNGCEQIDIDEAIAVSLAQHGFYLTDVDKKRLEIYVKKAINSCVWVELMKGQVFRERKFTDNNRLYSIDVYSVFDDKVMLLDYKTGKLTDDKLHNYGNQLDGYAGVLSKVYERQIEKRLLNFDDEEVKVYSYHGDKWTFELL